MRSMRGLPAADVVLMNPPFITWGSLGEEQRSTLSTVLGSCRTTRPDYSMGFVLKTLDEALRDGDALGALLPASVLTSESALPWRRALLDRANLRLLASLGHHHLFPHAIVQVTWLGVNRPGHPKVARPKVVTLRVGAGDVTEAGDALRALRGYQDRATGQMIRVRSGNCLRPLHTPSLNARHGDPFHRANSTRWHVCGRNNCDRSPTSLASMKGVQTGYNRAFLIKCERLEHFQRKEREFFRPAIVNDSLRSGRLSEGTWVFYPYDEEGRSFGDEETLKGAVPVYYKASSGAVPIVSRRTGGGTSARRKAVVGG